MDKGVYRIIDANLNRVMEAVRVCEDIIRFSSNNERLTRRLKNLRHNVSTAIKALHKKHLEELFSSRNIDDVGKGSIESEKNRENLVDLFLANTLFYIRKARFFIFCGLFKKRFLELYHVFIPSSIIFLSSSILFRVFFSAIP